MNTRDMVIFKNNGSCARVIYNSESFMVQDIRPLTNLNVVEIIYLESKEKNKGHATELLKQITDYFKDSIIVVKAEPLFPTKEEYDACLDFDDRVAKLKSFYEKRGFVDINNYVQYENSVAMCYNNKPYQEIAGILNPGGADD